MFWQNELLQKLKLKVTKVPNFTYIWFTSDATPNPEPKKFLLPYWSAQNEFLLENQNRQ